MRIVPAVDIRGGLCVNLIQGDYGQETVFSENPVDQAIQWYEGCKSIVHIVDLDGAKAGHCCIEDELRAMRDAGVPVEVGGGIRNMETITKLIALGVERVILGTAAHKSPDLLKDAANEYPERIVVGIDAKDVNQWCEHELNVRPAELNYWDTVRHSFTHYDLDIQPISVRLLAQSSKVRDTEDRIWYEVSSPPPGGIATPVSKLIQTLRSL